MRWLDAIIDLMDMSLNKLQELGDGQGSLATVHGVAKSWTGLSNFIFTLRQHIKEQRHYFANKGPSS